MEKSGRRIGQFRSRRLLSLVRPAAIAACLLITLTLSPLAAVEVDIFVSSFEVATGEPVVLEFTVRNANPSDTILTVAEVPPSFADSSSRKERRQIESPDGSSGKSITATVITREWIPSLSGSYAIGPFTVSVNSDSVTLPPAYITVVAPKTAEYTALRWIVPTGGARTGSPLRLSLEGFFTGTPVSVVCPAPENALLENVSADGGERRGRSRAGKGSPAITAVPGSEPGWIAVASYDWTPLAEGSQSLPMAILEYTPDSGTAGGNRKLASQPLSIQVVRGAVINRQTPINRALGNAFAPSRDNDQSDHTAKNSEASSAAVEKPAGLPAEVAGLPWRAGSYALILYNLRHAEYTRLFPARFRTVRLSAENALELGETLSVPPAAWKGVCVIGAVVLLSLGLFLRLLAGRLPVLRWSATVCFVLTVLLTGFAVSVYTRDLKPAGVVTGGDLLHIPEFNSTVVESLREGSTVQILRKAGDWLYVKTGSTLEGWLTAEQVMQYTATE